MSIAREDALFYLNNLGYIVDFVENNQDACESAFYHSQDALHMNKEQVQRVVESGDGLVDWVRNDLDSADGDLELWNAWVSWLDYLQFTGGIQ